MERDTYMTEDKTLDTVLDLMASLEAEDALVTEDKLAAALDLRKVSPVAGYVLMAGYRALRHQHARDERFRLKVLKLAPEHYKAIEDGKAPAKPRRNSNIITKQQEKDAARVAEITQTVTLALGFYKTWRLSSGKALGLATREDLLAEAATNTETAKGLQQNAKFYTKLAAEVPQGQTVQEAVSLADAHRIREACYA